MKQLITQTPRALITIAVIAVCGVILLIIVRADSAGISVNSQNVELSGGVVAVDDESSQFGSFLRFEELKVPTDLVIDSTSIGGNKSFDGGVTRSEITDYFGINPSVLWGEAGGIENASFIDDGEVLRVRYRPFTSGTGVGMGAGFDIDPRQELWCGMSVKIDSPHEFVESGKFGLGIYGGSHPGGGTQTIDGSSVRANWHVVNGKPVLAFYTYAPEYFKRGNQYGVTTKSNWEIPTDEWIRVVLGVNIGDAGKNNGWARLWSAKLGQPIEQRLELKNFQFIDASKPYQIDRFQFSTHYGGNQAKFSPSKNQFREFKDIQCGDTRDAVSSSSLSLREGS